MYVCVGVCVCVRMCRVGAQESNTLSSEKVDAFNMLRLIQHDLKASSESK